MSYRGKIRNVRWVRIESHNPYSDYSSYESCIVADLYDNDNNRLSKDQYVDITNDVLDYYDRERITRGLVEEVRNDLHNVWIDYYYDEDEGEDYLDGSLSDFI